MEALLLAVSVLVWTIAIILIGGVILAVWILFNEQP